MRSLLGRFHRPNTRSQTEQLFMLNSLGDGSTLSLDFTTGVLDPRLTFTRSTTGTFINSSGYVTSAAINAPRFDYDPTTTPPTPRGLLIEGSASNLCPNSQALTTGWGNANMITPTNPAITDPFGGTSATWKLVAASGSALHSWRHPVITLTAAAHTFSFWAKAAEYDRVIFSDPGSGIGACTFVLTGNGTATVVGGATNPLITLYPNGWYRCSVTITTLATAYAFGIVGYPSSGSTLSNFGAIYTANGTDGAYATGLQIELGSGASSYIPTGASTGNRAADDCLIDNISTAFGFNAAEGTILVKYGNRLNTGSMRSYTFLPASGAANQMFETAGVALNVYSSSIFTAQIGSTNASAGRVCAAYKVDDFAASVNGGAVSTDTSGALATSLTRLSIGGTIVNAAGYNFGPISLFKYWPTRLPDAQLQVLST